LDKKMPKKEPQHAKRLRIIGIPMDLGQKHRGVDMGPSALRYAGLSQVLQGLGYELVDGGNIAVPLRYSLPDCSHEQLINAIHTACTAAYKASRQAIKDGEIPIFLGGDHSVAIGTVGGVSHDETCGLIWLDAHADFNTPETSITGNIHGMALAVLLGLGPKNLTQVGRPAAKIKPEQVVIIGLRELDQAEKETVKASGCHFFTMRDIDELGMLSVIQKSLAILAPQKRIHLSLDLDVMEPAIAPGVGTPSPGGLTYREAQLAMEIIAESKKLSSVDVVEINPIRDLQNRTARLAVELLASLFGKSIL